MAENTQFPLTLQSVTFTKLNFEAIFDFDVTKNLNQKLTPNNTIGVQEDPNQENVMVMQMTTIINPNKTKDEPYHIEAVVLAYFNYDPSLSKEEAARGVTITGHNVCYGAIREAVSWISGRLPYGPINLGLSILQPSKQSDDLKKSE